MRFIVQAKPGVHFERTWEQPHTHPAAFRSIEEETRDTLEKIAVALRGTLPEFHVTGYQIPARLLRLEGPDTMEPKEIIQIIKGTSADVGRVFHEHIVEKRVS